MECLLSVECPLLVDAPFFETPREANPFIFLAMHLKPNKEI
jgi:hypothetical protein